MAALDIRLLGGLRFECNGSVVELPPVRVRGLVAYLLLHRGVPQSRARIAYLLWPDSDEAQARTNLRKALHHLRRSLPDVERFLRVEGQHLHWRSDAPYDLDVARFDEAASEADRARSAGDRARERACLEEAARHYRGDLLPELYEAWLDAPRERLRERFGAVVERLAALLEEQREYAAATPYVRRLVQHDPLVEKSHRRLMRLHALGGERAKAMHVYHRCASLLQRELGIDPAPETQRVYEQVLRLEGDPAPPKADAPSIVRSRSSATVVAPLVGRRGALERLREAWGGAAGGRPSLVLVTGDSGIGKTRVVEEFVSRLPRREAVVAATRCYAAEGALAYAPVTALLRHEALAGSLTGLDPVWRSELSRLLPELAGEGASVPGPLVESWQRARLFEALARAVLSVPRVVAVFDDLQWCDRDSLEWLRYVLRFDPRARLLVVGTVRAHELAANPGLASLLTTLQHDALLQEIELPPLDLAETDALAGAVSDRTLDPDALATLYAETEGNPLFVLETLRHDAHPSGSVPATERAGTVAPLPPKLHAVIVARFDRLSPSSLELTGMAAAIGREFGFELLVRVSGWGEDAVVRGLDELWRSRIVRESGAGQYDFSHDKLREVAYGSLSLTRRQLVHRAIGEALEALHVADLDAVAGQIAHHHELSGNADRAVPFYRRAGDAAVRLHAHDDAVASYRRALALIDALSVSGASTAAVSEVHAELLERIGDVFAHTGAHEAARDNYERALARVGRPEQLWRARLLRHIALTWVAQYRYDEARGVYESAEEALEPEADGAGPAWWREWIEVLLGRCLLHYWQHEWRAMEALTTRVERVVEQHGTALQRSTFFMRMANMGFTRDRYAVSDAVHAYSKAALGAALESGDVAMIATARFTHGFNALWHGDLPEAREMIGVALASSERSGAVLLRTRCLTYLGFIYRMLGDVDRTRSYALRGLKASKVARTPEYRGAAHGHLAWVAWRGGRLDASERSGRAAQRAWRSGLRYPLQWCATLPLLATHLAKGQIAAAAECAVELLDGRQQRLPDDLAHALGSAVRAFESGGRAAASTSLERAVELAQRARLL
jgi:DNA-binding SARP family transcriptional activator